MSQSQESGRPERAIGPLQLLALGVNGIVGVGIFFAPATVAQAAPGLGTVAVFVGTGLALLPAAFAFATLGGRFDEDGGPVVFARAAFGPRVSFLVGWVAFVSAFFSAAAVTVGLVNATTASLGWNDDSLRRGAAVALVAVLSAIVASGIRLSARVWTSLTVLKLVPLLLLVAAFALAAGSRSAPPAGPPTVSWLAAALTVMFAFQGFEIVPVVAGQVRSSSRVIPFATVGSLLLAILLYGALALACVLALPALGASHAPLADAAGVLGGPTLARLVAAGTSVSALGIAFGMFVTSPRFLSSLASGEDHLLGLDRVSAKGVPLRALAVTSTVVAALVAAGDLSELFALSSIAVLAQYGVSAAALISLARSRRVGLRPRDAWPAVPTLAVALALVVFGATRRELLVALATVLVGVALMVLARRRRRDGLY